MGGWDHDEPPNPRAELAAANQRKQVELALTMVQRVIIGGEAFGPADLASLHRAAMQGLVDEPGRFRSDDVRITGSRHLPPPAINVLGLITEMFETLNIARTRGETPAHLAAYVLWRINWIHPFAPDGNGRTSRVSALVVMFGELKRLPVHRADRPSFVELLSRNRFEYTDALEAADAAWNRGATDVSDLAALLTRCFEDSLR